MSPKQNTLTFSWFPQSSEFNDSEAQDSLFFGQFSNGLSSEFNDSETQNFRFLWSSFIQRSKVYTCVSHDNHAQYTLQRSLTDWIQVSSYIPGGHEEISRRLEPPLRAHHHLHFRLIPIYETYLGNDVALPTALGTFKFVFHFFQTKISIFVFSVQTCVLFLEIEVSILSVSLSRSLSVVAWPRQDARSAHGAQEAQGLFDT